MTDKSEEFKKRTNRSLADFQQFIDKSQISPSIYSPGKVFVRRHNFLNIVQEKSSETIELSYTDILRAGGYTVPTEVNPAYAQAGSLGHELIISELTNRLNSLPRPNLETELLEELLKHPKLAAFDETEGSQMWMFSPHKPLARDIAQKIIRVVNNYLQLKRQNPLFEKTAVIPLGIIHEHQVVLITRGDAIEGNVGENTIVDNFKTGLTQTMSLKRVHLDTFVQEATAAAIENSSQVNRPAWRNGKLTDEWVYYSQKPLSELEIRPIPLGRIVCTDGLLGQEVKFSDNTRQEKRRFYDLAAEAIAKKLKLSTR
ncbi:hypothetical protein M1403_01685 [Patescibacteria group bacterium]|nr:hypothetical protein [Patescibacteria group bacterium]